MKYCAFISYNRADTAVATWLLRRLETYRVPKRLVGTRGADRDLFPVGRPVARGQR
jgi:hypothetical protein